MVLTVAVANQLEDEMTLCCAPQKANSELIAKLSMANSILFSHRVVGDFDDINVRHDKSADHLNPT